MEEQSAKIQSYENYNPIKETVSEAADRIENETDTKDLDLLNLHVKEMRQPMWEEVNKNSETVNSHSPAKNYNRTYLPNG